LTRIDRGCAAERGPDEAVKTMSAVLTRMLPAHPEDDIALLAVRLHPQGRPRPRGAGPNRIPDGIPDQPGAGTTSTSPHCD